MVKIYKKGKSEKLSKNFNSKEFDCHGKGCCTETKIDEQLVVYLQQIRDYFGKAITINSGYRCEQHNRKIGGASKSLHKIGTAADIVVKGIKPEEVAKYAETLGIKGIGLYSWGCHIDTRTTKFFWYSDKQEPRSTFGGNPPEEKKKEVEIDASIKEWQKAAIADGFKFASGADGIWGKECEAVAKKAICKKYTIGYKNKNLTKVVQKAVGVTADGKFGKNTKNAVIKWQKRMGLTADGIVGYNTWKKILGI